MFIIVIRLVQTRAFAVSIFLVPVSLVTIQCIVMFSLSGFLLMIFLLVFVGGLLVLLVRLTSVLSLERFTRSKPSIILIALIIRISAFILSEEHSKTSYILTWSYTQILPLWVLFLIFLVRLRFITWSFSFFKRIRRVTLRLSLIEQIFYKD